MTVLFLDTNIPMYAAGDDHPLREPCLNILRLVARHADSFASDAEVLQEILHRYVSLRQIDRAQALVRRFAGLMTGRLVPVLPDDVEAAAEMAYEYPSLSARDLVHLAIMTRSSVGHLVSADSGFDAVNSIERLDPSDVATWAPTFGLP